MGQKLDKEISQPIDKIELQKNALSFNTRSARNWELFKACMAREWLLMKRNSFVHVFKSAQVLISCDESFMNAFSSDGLRVLFFLTSMVKEI